MDDAHEVRAELRSYTLRRCIRFYSALIIMSLTWSAAEVARAGSVGDPGRGILMGGGLLLLVLTGVELSAMLVMRDMAAARERIGGGIETPFWRFAQGPRGSIVAALFFLGVAVLFLANGASF